jgi:hypothetical protein
MGLPRARRPPAGPCVLRHEPARRRRRRRLPPYGSNLPCYRVPGGRCLQQVLQGQLRQPWRLWLGRVWPGQVEGRSELLPQCRDSEWTVRFRYIAIFMLDGSCLVYTRLLTFPCLVRVSFVFVLPVTALR